MTASPRRWEGGRRVIFCGGLEEQLRPRDGCRLLWLFVEGFGIYLFTFSPGLRQALHFVPGAGRVGGGRAGLSGGRQTRAGRCGDGDGDRGGTAAEDLLSESPELGESSSRGGKWSSPPLPPTPPKLPSPAAAGWEAGPEGHGDVPSAGSFQKHPGEVGGNAAHGTYRRSVGPW